MSPLRLTALVPLLACLATLGAFEPPAEAQPVVEGRQPQAAVDSEGVIWLTYARGRTIWLGADYERTAARRLTPSAIAALPSVP